MLRIKNTNLITAAIGVLFLFCYAAPEKAAAQNTPPGSYKNSCFESKVFNKTTLVSKCVTKNEKMVDAKLYDFDQCSGDISNQNGVLTCSKVVKVNTGGAPPPPPPSEPANKVIERAFRDVYGYPAPAQRFAYWEAQVTAKTADYAKIVAEESKRQNAEPIARKLMIARVYKDTMGRISTTNEINYWLPKTEYYKQIFEASRGYLYAPAGAKDLIETVERALKSKNGKSPTEQEIKEAITKYRNTKAIYDEM